MEREKAPDPIRRLCRVLASPRAAFGRGGGASPLLARAPTPSCLSIWSRFTSRAAAPMVPCGSRRNCGRGGPPCGHNRWRGSCARPAWWSPSSAAVARAHDAARSGGDACSGSGPAALYRSAPDRLWIADITYLLTEQDGFFSRQ